MSKVEGKKSKDKKGKAGVITPVELSDKDAHFLKLALKEAKRGRYTTSPNPAVGCVMVRDDDIIGQGFHHAAGQPHAEIMALKDAGGDVAGATAYVTLEPCCHYGRTPPCSKALIEAGIKRVVIGTRDPNPKVAGGGIALLQEAGVEVVLAGGKLADKCYRLNRAFFKSITTQRPFVITKLGMSIDGKIALSDGSSKWITNEQSRSDGQRLRLWSDVLITTAATVRVDNPRYNVRIDELPAEVMSGLDTALIRQPLKVVIDTQGTLCQGYDEALLRPFSIFSQGECFIAVGTRQNLEKIHAAVQAAQEARTELTLPAARTKSGWQVSAERIIASGPNFVLERFAERVSILVLPQQRDHVSLEALLDFLGTKELRVAMIEAGAGLTSAFLNQGLVDECYCYLAPMFLGHSAQSGLKLPEPPTLAAAQRFAHMDSTVIGDNVLVVLSQPVHPQLPKAPAKKITKTTAKTSAQAAAPTAAQAAESATKTGAKPAAQTAAKAATKSAKTTTKAAAKAKSATKTAPKSAPKVSSAKEAAQTAQSAPKKTTAKKSASTKATTKTAKVPAKRAPKAQAAQ